MWKPNKGTNSRYIDRPLMGDEDGVSPFHFFPFEDDSRSREEKKFSQKKKKKKVKQDLILSDVNNQIRLILSYLINLPGKYQKIKLN